jgi:hypothetical protein
MTTETEFEHIPSDRIELLQIAVQFVGMFQREDSAIQSEPTGDELKVYTAALKLLEKELKRGPSIAETVATKRTVEVESE